MKDRFTRSLLWHSDAKLAVEAINSISDPTKWSIRHLVLGCKHSFKEFGWQLRWIDSSANEAANSLAKLTLRNNIVFSYDVNVNSVEDPNFLVLVEAGAFNTCL